MKNVSITQSTFFEIAILTKRIIYQTTLPFVLSLMLAEKKVWHEGR